MINLDIQAITRMGACVYCSIKLADDYTMNQVMKEIKRLGFNQTKIQRENLLPKQTMANIKAGKSITLETLNKICLMCRKQPGDIIEVIPTDEEKIKYF
jgi:putative transcriptional regulator